MGNAKFSDDFKRDAVHQIIGRDYPVAEVRRLKLELARVTEEGSVANFHFGQNSPYC